MSAPVRTLVTVLSVVSIAFTAVPGLTQSAPSACPIGGHTALSCPIINDDVIRQAVTLRLAGSVITPCNRVNVCVQDGVVTLTGVVDTRSRWDLATILAGSVRGVRCVQNLMGLCPVTDADMQIVAGVRSALGRALFGSRGLMVESVNGVVRLTGMVATEFDREQAPLIAGSVPGVVEVQNNLIVRDPYQNLF